MSPLVPLIWLAGVLQLLVASSNFFAPRMLRFGANYSRLDPTVREIVVLRGPVPEGCLSLDEYLARGREVDDAVRA
ncbi:MAG: hypothetical protein ACJ8F7_18765, partial [Gemmataceae bacterium]